MSCGIFISYRWDDSAAEARLLYSELKSVFPKKHIFFDRENLRPGQILKDKIARELDQCRILVLVIGPSWAEISRRRRDDPDDHSRFEIDYALRRNLLIIPVLTDGASLSRQDTESDETLARLARLENFSLKTASLGN